MSDAATIKKALGGKHGKCHCPAHPDSTPSLSVNEKNGKVLVRCHAGCSQEAVIAALRQRGLWSGKSERNRTKMQNIKSDDTKLAEYHRFQKAMAILRAAAGAVGPVREWNIPSRAPLERYLEGRGINTLPENAMLLSSAQSERLTGKDDDTPGTCFPAMVFPIIDATCKLLGAHLTWLSKDGSTKLNTDNPKRMFGPVKGGYVQLAEIDPDHFPEKLIIGEGIENALSAMQITGLPTIAALSAGNMHTLNPPPSTEVIIASDADDTGKEAAESLAQHLLGTNCNRIVRIAEPEKPDGVNKYDFNDQLRDALKEGVDLAELREAIFQLEPVERSETVGPVTVEEFLKMQFPPRQYLLKPWLTTTGLVMMDAAAGHGKTWLALSVGYAVASGQPLMNWEIERRGKVLYVDGELPGELLQRRLQILGAPPSDNLLVLSRSQFEMHGKMMPDLATNEGRDFLDSIIENDNIDLIILDSVSTLVRSGMDNDVESWRAIQDWSLMHRARGRAVIYLHHHGRTGNPRGTSSREIVLDTRVKLTRDEDLTTEHETAFKLEFPKAREFYGADAAPMMAYLSTKTGVVDWRRESVKDSNRDRVRELSKQGWKVTDIAKELNLTKGRISQIMKEIREVVSVKE
jgi:putative DNA primase/helicase